MREDIHDSKFKKNYVFEDFHTECNFDSNKQRGKCCFFKKCNNSPSLYQERKQQKIEGSHFDCKNE